MRMQESLVSVDEREGQLRLSGLLSEWLFSSEFWSDFNAKHGTMFDQFEEDEVDVSIVAAVIDALNSRVYALKKSDERNIEFVYRWTSGGKPLEKIVSKESLLSELMIFRGFLVDAVARNLCVTFSL